MPDKPSTTVQANIRSIAELDRSAEAQRTLTERIADIIGGFSGSMSFVALHAVWFVLWFLINTKVLPWVKPFDPYPFILLAMIVSVEGVLLSTFVLMKQNRMQKKSDARDHLDLQINLLSEEEITKTLQLLRAMARHLNIPDQPTDEALEEMTSTTSIDLVAQQIKHDLPQA